MRYFAYCRKSTESEERQALSIPAQRDEVARIREKYPDIEIIETFEESRTAKAPGRPVFNTMMQRLERGDAEGVIAWHPDRLARNSIDGGLIIYMLDRGTLKDLKFSTYTFENSSQGKFMLQIMFGYSKYYVDNLSENVKRGIRRKLEQGVKPGLPPPGYKNDPVSRTIIPDPERFEQVREMWNLLLSRKRTVTEIWRMADREWGFRTRQSARLGGRPLALSSIYKIFSNRFYCGFISHKGALHNGSHSAMVTPGEFEHAQGLIRRQFRTARQKHQFAFTGMMRCGTCGCSVTAELQTNKYGRTYEYYRCTKKRRDFKCPEKYISRGQLEVQILSFLRAHEFHPAIADWATALEGQSREDQKQIREQRAAQIGRQLADGERSLATLTDLRVRNLIDDSEFVAKRAEILGTAEQLKAQRVSPDGSPEQWLEFLAVVKAFNEYAPKLFEQADAVMKRRILSLVGSNFSLTDKRLNIQAADFYALYIRGPDFLSGWGQRENIRTFWGDDPRDKAITAIRELETMLTEEQKVLYLPKTSPTSLRPRKFRQSRNLGDFPFAV
jgi:DNA invertase Pin-like site-specific DNA recombinase